jgi:hypothetical protein
MRRLIARHTTWWGRLFVLAVAVTSLVDAPPLLRWPVLAALGVLTFVRPPWDRDRAPVDVDPPVRGRWTALNSPATKVPSHGVRAYGQTYAIDILHPRPPGARPKVPWLPRLRRPRSFTTFGEPVLAMHAGTVVRAGGGQRDHRARQSWPELAYLLTVEGFVRELGGAPFVLGNHVIVDHGDGVVAAYAHLRRRSVRVAVGDRVEVGQQLGEVGCSGNTSEPHLHVHLMDDAEPTAAAGVPFRWRGLDQPADTDPSRSTKPVSTVIEPGLPADGQVFTSA